jgi:hypothetical protein
MFWVNTFILGGLPSLPFDPPKFHKNLWCANQKFYCNQKHLNWKHPQVIYMNHVMSQHLANQRKRNKYDGTFVKCDKFEKMIYTNEYLVDLYLGFWIHLYESILVGGGAQLNESIVKNKEQQTTYHHNQRGAQSHIQLPQCII